MEAHIDQDGAVTVEGQKVGELQGFRFTPVTASALVPGDALNAATDKVLGNEIIARAQLIAEAPNDQFILVSDNVLRWKGQEVARLAAGESEIEPELHLLADDHLAGAHREWVEARLKAYLRHHITQHLKPLFDLRAAENLEGVARGLAFQLVEALGVLERGKVAADVKGLDQTVRGAMRTLGVRFGAHHIYMPAILKPKPRALAAQLWFLKRNEVLSDSAATILQLALSGRTSWPADPALDPDLYRVLGYKLLGARAVRVDIVERMADLIRTILSYREEVASMPPPNGRIGRNGFTVTVEMTSLLGCSGEDMAQILRGLGYVCETKPRQEVEAQVKAAQEAYYAKQAPVEAVATSPDAAVPAETPPPETAQEKIEEKTPEVSAETVQAPQATPPEEADAATPEREAPKDVSPVVDVWRFARPARAFSKPAKGKADRQRDAVQENRETKPRPREGEKETKPSEKRRKFKPHKRGQERDSREKMSERRLVFSTENKNDNALDPNNPFAKLAALKAQLDEKAN